MNNLQQIKQHLKKIDWDKLYNTFYRINSDVIHFELVIDPACSQKCYYCYYTRYKHYELSNIKKGKALKPNILRVIDAYIDMASTRKDRSYVSFELFGGEYLTKPFLYDTIEYLCKEAQRAGLNYSVIIPTNGLWIIIDEFRDAVSELCRKYPISISFSFDGEPVEDIIRQPRMLYLAKRRRRLLYDRAFEFALSHPATGFHPMLSALLSHKIWDQLKWFADRLNEAGLSPNSLYLLHVRNHDWTIDRASNLLYALCRFLKYCFDIGWLDKFLYRLNVLRPTFRWFNLLDVSRTSRSLHCSAQLTLCTYAPTLSTYFCHRLLTEQFKIAELRSDGYHVVNPALWLTLLQPDYMLNQKCRRCWLNTMCSRQCLGNVFEQTKTITLNDENICIASVSILLAKVFSHLIAGTGIIERLLEYGCLEGPIAWAVSFAMKYGHVLLDRPKEVILKAYDSLQSTRTC